MYAMSAQMSVNSNDASGVLLTNGRVMFSSRRSDEMGWESWLLVST